MITRHTVRGSNHEIQSAKCLVSKPASLFDTQLDDLVNEADARH